MTNELITQAKACKSADELLALAKENNIDMTAEEAAAKYAELHAEGELSDDELDGAAGGACNSQKGSQDLPEIGETVTFADGYACDCSCKVFTWDACALGWHAVTCTGCGKEHIRRWDLELDKYSCSMI